MNSKTWGKEFDVFEVSDAKVLRPRGSVDPVTRADYHDGEFDGWDASPASFAEKLEEHEPLQWATHSLYEEELEELDAAVDEARDQLSDAEACEEDPDVFSCETNKADREGEVARLRDALAVAMKKRDAMDPDPSVGVVDWIRAMDPVVFAKRVVPVIQSWFEESPDFGSGEEDHLPQRLTGQERAFSYFDDLEACRPRDLGVRVIDGDRTGSDYSAAELTIDVDEANARAERLGVAIRFVRAGEGMLS